MQNLKTVVYLYRKRYKCKVQMQSTKNCSYDCTICVEWVHSTQPQLRISEVQYSRLYTSLERLIELRPRGLSSIKSVLDLCTSLEYCTLLRSYNIGLCIISTCAIVGTNYKPREGRYSLLPSTGFQHQQLLLRETVRDLSKTVVVLVPDPLVVLGKIYQVLAQANPDLVAQSLLDSTILANPKAQAF